MQPVIDAVLAAAGSPWVYPAVFLLTVGDAFLVILPSETVVVALGTLAMTGHGPTLWILVPVAALAAMIGDSLTYAIARRVGIARFRFLRRPAMAKAFGWAGHALERRAALVLLTARFIPFGRIAVNLAAGGTGFPYPRFLGLTAIAGACWALYNAIVGAIVGAWLGDNPVLAVAVSVVVAVGLGIAVDRTSAVITAASARRTGRRHPASSWEHSGHEDPDSRG